MNSISDNMKSKYLIIIKRLLDKDEDGCFEILDERKKNREFIRTYGLSVEDIKYIIRGLDVSNCFGEPERDKNPKYPGWVFKYTSMYNGIKIYIKIRVESTEKGVCISIHEFGLYEEED